MTLNWTDVGLGTIPTGYLITIEKGTPSSFVPLDGTVYANQTDLINNAFGYLNVSHIGGARSVNFPTLLSGETYTFKIYPYTNALTDIDYNINPTQLYQTQQQQQPWHLTFG
jgi:hypothetical protein